MKMKWNESMLLLFGDYEFLCKILKAVVWEKLQGAQSWVPST